MESQNTPLFDVAIAGAGLSGVLTARNLLVGNPNSKVIVVDRQKSIGGRTRTSQSDLETWNAGLGLISEDLYNFWNQILTADPDSPDLPSFGMNKLDRIGVVNASKVSEVPSADLLTPKGVRVIGGLAASRDWTMDDDFFAVESAREGEAKSFSDVWPKTRKDPSSAVLSQLNSLMGIPNMWQAAGSAVCQRAHRISNVRMISRQDDAFLATLDPANYPDRLEIRLGEQVISADLSEDKTWRLKTQLGEIASHKLIVAQPPWEALDWLPQKYWPPEVLTLANRARPASLVVLSEQISNRAEELMNIPDAVIIPVEDVHALICRDGTLCIQAVLEFELSMDHPEVVKAIRRLRRARKRLGQIYPWLETTDEHLALLPVGWSQPYNFSEHRYVEKMMKISHPRNHLYFCGDSYGTTYDGDANLLRSVQSVSEQILAP